MVAFRFKYNCRSFVGFDHQMLVPRTHWVLLENLFGSNVSLCHLCLAGARDSSLTYFPRCFMSTFSRDVLLVALMLEYNYTASFTKCDLKWFIFIACVISVCILGIVWNRSSHNSNFPLLPSSINVFVDAGFKITDVVRCCWDAIPVIASANLLIDVLWWLDARLWLFSNIGKVVHRESCLIMFCGCVGSRCVETCPERKSEISCGALCPVTMWWVYVSRSMFFSLTSKSLSSKVIIPRVSSIDFVSLC